MKLVTRAFMRDPYPALRSLREGSQPAVPIVRNGLRQWVVTRYDDVRRVLVDRSFGKDLAKGFRNSQQAIVRGSPALLPREVRRGGLDRDGADHRRLRSLIQEPFRPTGWPAPATDQALADQLLDALPLGEPVDLAERFARPLATTSIAEVVGVPPEER